MKRVNLFCGHYGSGKTNVAINFAYYLKKQGLDVAIADIDIVNPYFRTKDSENELKSAGIDVISLPFANSNVDLPALPPEVYSLVQNRTRAAVFDIGGDDRGAYALGRYAPYILEENDYNMFFVANFCRPLTRTAKEAMEVMKEIEKACGIPFTALVNNSNLGRETTLEGIREWQREAQKLSELSGLPIAMTCAEESLCTDALFPLKLQPTVF
ncbi:MAG: hypothetical protein PUC29_05500 [Clostridia bacterium]|nr:hypothetical protein [Clostridia bacterium]